MKMSSVVDSHGWDYQLDSQLTDEFYPEFAEQLGAVRDRVLKKLEIGFVTQKANSKGNKDQHNDIDLKSLTEKNKQCKQELDEKLKELEQHKAQYENYKQECKLLAQEVKETHEALLMAKKYYKKFLKIYFTIESVKDSKQIIFLQFFTESKKKSDNYSVRLSRDTETCQYTLMDMNPKIRQFDEVQKSLLETNDVPGTLSFIRQCFLKLNTNKNCM